MKRLGGSWLEEEYVFVQCIEHVTFVYVHFRLSNYVAMVYSLTAMILWNLAL